MKQGSIARYAAVCLTTAIVVVLCVQFVDRPVAAFIAAHMGSVLPVQHALQAELLLVPFGVIWILFCGIATILGYRIPRVGIVTVLAAFSLVWALVTNYFLLQPFFGRIDIWHYLMHRNVYGFAFLQGHGGNGFPSGHTVIAASFLLVFWHAYPRTRIFVALAIALVMAGLIVARWHFVSDTLAGLFVGAIAATLTVRLWGDASETGAPSVHTSP